MTDLELAHKLFTVATTAAKKCLPSAPMRPWKKNEEHIVAGWIAVARWIKKKHPAIYRLKKGAKP